MEFKEMCITKTLLEFYNKEEYKSFQRFLRRDFLSLENCWVNLAVVSLDKSISKEKKEYEISKKSFHRPRTSEHLNADTEKLVKLKEIFGNGISEIVSRKRVLIYGKAGIGKTTLCKKIVYNFYQKGIWADKFDRIIYITLRNLKTCKQRENLDTKLADIYAKEFFNSHDLGEAFVTMNEADQKKVLYILDGWDEIQDLLEDGHFMKPVLNELLRMPFVIVTSRPYALHIRTVDFDDVLETVGFSEKNVFNYIENIFPEELSTQNEILDFIHQHGVVAGLVSIPIQLDMLCYLWNLTRETMSPFNSQIITMTALYKILVFKLWEEFLKRSGKFKTKELENLDCWKGEVLQYVMTESELLTQLVFQGFLNNRIEFTVSDFSSAGTDIFTRDRVKNSHFLHCLNIEEVDENKKSYVFIHLTFQEFMAAFHIFNHLHEQRIVDLISNNKYNPRFQVIWSFVAGLIDNEKVLATFFNYLECDPIELTGIPHLVLILNCINECPVTLSLDPRREERLFEDLSNFILKEKLFNAVHTLELPIKVLDRLLYDVSNWRYKTTEIFINQKRLPDAIILRLLEMAEQERRKTVRPCRSILCRTTHFLSEKIISTITDTLSKLRVDEDHNEYLYLLAMIHQRRLPKRTLDILLHIFDSGDPELQDSVAFVFSHLKDNSPLEERLGKIISESSSEDAIMNSLKCLRYVNLAFNTQDLIADVICNGSVSVANICNAVKALFSLKHFHSNAINKICHHVLPNETCSVETQMQFLKMLSCRENLTEETITLLLSLLEFKNYIIKNEVLKVLKEQKELPASAGNTLLDILNTSQSGDDTENFIFHLTDALSTPKILTSATITEDLAKLLCSYEMDCLDYRFWAILRSLQNRKHPEFLVSFLFTLLQKMVLSGDPKAKELIYCLRNQDPSNKSDMLEFFVELLKMEDFAEETSLMFNQNIHLFENAYVLQEIETILNESSSFVKSYVIQALKYCKNLPQSILLRLAHILFDLRKENIDEIILFSDTIFQYQSELPDVVLKYLISHFNDERGDFCVKTIMNRPMNEILRCIDKDNWLHVFQKVILTKMRIERFPLTTLVVNENMKTVTFLTPSDFSLDIPFLDVKQILPTLRREEFPQRIDYFTRYLMFHSKEENLEFVNNFRASDFVNVQSVASHDDKNHNVRFSRDSLCFYTRIDIVDGDTCKNNDDCPLPKLISDLILLEVEQHGTLHIDLRSNGLQDKSLKTMMTFLKKCGKKIHTIILSDNEITDKGARYVIGNSSKVNLKYLFLDRNFIYLNRVHFEYDFSNEDSSLQNSNLELLDISGNFIPAGKLLGADEDFIAKPNILIIKGITPENQNCNKNYIKASKILHSGIIYAHGFIPLCDQYLDSPCQPHEGITESQGCIILAQSRTNHAYLIIDWIPPNDGYGQRQLINADLVVNPDKRGRFKIRIMQLCFKKFVEKIKKGEIQGRVFPTTENISKFLQCLFDSQDTADIYSYSWLAGLTSKQEDGNYNCITWADEMLAKSGIRINSMKKTVKSSIFNPFGF